MPLNNYPTWEMTSVADQRRLLAEPAAVVCVWFEWSVPARLARDAVGHWHERWHLYSERPVVPLYVLDGDRVPELFGWMRDTLREGGGYGSVYVFKRGKVVLRVPSVLNCGLVPLAKACDAHLHADDAPARRTGWARRFRWF